MKLFLELTICLCLFINLSSAQAQSKPYYNTEEQVFKAANESLKAWSETEEWNEWITEHKFEGAYTFNITIGGKKGEVKTVNAVTREGGSIPLQNRLKDAIKAYQFPFIMPKDKSYRFKYEFKF